MKKTIWKFGLPIGETTTHKAPWLWDSILHVGHQDGVVCVWAEVNPDSPRAEWFNKSFVVIGTGWEVPPEHVHRGTVQIGDMVWHVYEKETA